MFPTNIDVQWMIYDKKVYARMLSKMAVILWSFDMV